MKSVLGLENSLVNYLDLHLQSLQSEMRSMRSTLEGIQRKERCLQDTTSRGLQSLGSFRAAEEDVKTSKGRHPKHFEKAATLLT